MDSTVTVGAESDDVRWFPVDALPAPPAPGFAGRLAVVPRVAAGRTAAAPLPAP
ncbi:MULTISPECIES: hypothetical protein [unclassified Curtobacterium]|uniref:hypothetical protein n=1 Tax=unclassified Curtobacterium TaxID=257496 RepID=UPI0015E87BC3|nr:MULTISPECIES: hypothetical protein [unclassified Curtobacterium]